MSVAFTTRDLSPRDRIPYWVDVATKAYFGHGFSAPTETFAGSLQASHLNNILLSRCECGPCDVTRTRREIAGDDIDDMILAVRLSGRSTFSQNGRDEIINPGTLFVQDTGRPLRLNFPMHTTSICVSIPRDVWQERIGSAAMTGNVSTKRPVAGLAAEFLTLLAARSNTLEVPVKARLAEQALDLIALALTAGDGTPVFGRALHPAPPPGALPQRARGSAAGAPHDWRNRLQLGLLRPFAFHAAVPGRVRHDAWRLPQGPARGRWRRQRQFAQPVQALSTYSYASVKLRKALRNTARVTFAIAGAEHHAHLSRRRRSRDGRLHHAGLRRGRARRRNARRRP